MTKGLEGKVALVTGASRGVGKGIAEELAQSGVKVYATGRTVEEVTFDGECLPITCDHTNDEQVADVFKRIQTEQNRLDILVNNAWGGYEQMMEGQEFTWIKPFWEQSTFRWDSMFSAGVRANYIASSLAAKTMVAQKSGLIVNISYWSAQKHIANVAYGVSKAATDKMTADMAHELKDHSVSVVSLYPGLVRTEKVMANAEYIDLSNSESPRFVGRATVALASDPRIMDKSGSVLVAASCAQEYGFKDVDGKQPRPLTLDEA